MSISQDIADWALALRLDDVPEEVKVAACSYLLDGLGTASAAARTNAADPALTVARALGGPPQATILAGNATESKVGAPAAALANGVLVHALDFDDTHAGGLVHATAPVLPAVLAVGEETCATGADVLAAAIVGLETVCRLGAVVPHGFHARGLHPTAICGVFAAALAAARLYHLSARQTVNALGIAGSQAGGLMEFLNSSASTKQLHPGFAAHNGVLAARLAAAGATGPESVFEGEYGLYHALLGRRIDSPQLVAELGKRWELSRTTIKPYPACQLSHAALDAAAKVRTQLDTHSITQIKEIEVEIHPDAATVVCGPGKEHPLSSYAAKFSMPWCVAALLIDGSLSLDTFDRVNRPDVITLAKRIRHKRIDFGGVASDQPGTISVLLTDGTRHTAHVRRSAGGPDDPNINTLVHTKALANLGSGNAARTIDSFMTDLAKQPTLTRLIAALQVAATTS